MSKTPRTDARIKEIRGDLTIFVSDEGRVIGEFARQLETELSDLKASEQRFAKCFERIAKAFGITSPLVLMAMAENDEENYAEILARYIEKQKKH